MGHPKVIRWSLLALGSILALVLCIATPLSFHAHAKAIRVASALMEPNELTRGYDRWIGFEPLGICWTVRYTSHGPSKDDPSVSVDLFGHVDYRSKYFVDRASQIATP